nr:MAG TPA: hypothetical protein [Caudoviricetes sp.]
MTTKLYVLEYIKRLHAYRSIDIKLKNNIILIIILL